MTTIANGRLASRSTEAGFLAKLTAGTSLSFSLSGTLDGTINGMPISGVGNVQYVFNFGASAWVKSKDTIASAPDLPAGPIKFIPGPNSTGNASVSTTGVVVNDAGTELTSVRSKDHWPTKGRTAQITVSVWDQAAPCDMTTVSCATDCTTAFPGACTQECMATQTGLGC